MILAHRIRLAPKAEQEQKFVRACGVARFAYNWALAQWKRQYAVGEKPTEAALRKQLNAMKDAVFPWMREVSKNVPQQAIKNLGRAYGNFFDDLKKYRRGELSWKRVRNPKFKKKGRRDAFRADNGTDKTHPNAVCVDGARMLLPRIGWVPMCEEVRFAGSIRSVVVSRRADGWYASVSVEVPDEPAVHALANTRGVDLGLTTLATLDDGTKICAPKPLRRLLAKLKRISRSLSRKRRGSKNRAKAKITLARLHRRIADIRADALHKLTTDLVRNAATIVIEDLNVAGMLANRHLARAIADVGFFEFRRQLEYKSAMAGCTVVIADRWYPSSKQCSVCESKHEALTIGDRTWTCASCGTFHDRDVNAAVNLARYPESWAGAACGAEGTGGEHQPAVKPAA